MVRARLNIPKLVAFALANELRPETGAFFHFKRIVARKGNTTDFALSGGCAVGLLALEQLYSRRGRLRTRLLSEFVKDTEEFHEMCQYGMEDGQTDEEARLEALHAYINDDNDATDESPLVKRVCEAYGIDGQGGEGDPYLDGVTTGFDTQPPWTRGGTRALRAQLARNRNARLDPDEVRGIYDGAQLYFALHRAWRQVDFLRTRGIPQLADAIARVARKMQKQARARERSRPVPMTPPRPKRAPVGPRITMDEFLNKVTVREEVPA